MGTCVICRKPRRIIGNGKCATCVKRIRHRVRYATDPEFRWARHQFQRRYRDNLRAAQGSHTRAEWLERVAEYDGRCAYCLEPLEVPTRDHMTPVTWPLGTSDDISNIVPACTPCNTRKGDNNLLLYLRARTLAFSRGAAPSPPTGS